jgi:hypothetical protein
LNGKDGHKYINRYNPMAVPAPTFHFNNRDPSIFGPSKAGHQS